MAPYVNNVVIDSNDQQWCDSSYDSPPVITEGAAGFPQDGTDVLRRSDRACGVSPARFVFWTSDLADYTDTSHEAKMQVRIAPPLAKFVESDTCEGVIDATGEFPRIEGCRFIQHEARLILATRLVPNNRYSITLRVVMPDGETSASENNYHLSIEYYQMKVIEGTMSPVDLGHSFVHAKDESVWNTRETVWLSYQTRGYITGLSWRPAPTYTSRPGAQTVLFTFGVRTFGVMSRAERFYIDVIAFPTDVWDLGQNGDDCGGRVIQGFTCVFHSFAGAPSASRANGIRMEVGTTPADFLLSDTTFEIEIPNPTQAVNALWTATSFRMEEGIQQQPYTVFLDKPIAVLGKPDGIIVDWESAAINAEHWATLEVRFMNTIIPQRGIFSGTIVIMPPQTFTVIPSAVPQIPDIQYNALPCVSWLEEERLNGRWVCTLEDNTVYGSTPYRVRLKVRNPSFPGAARSWRVELWQVGNSKPVSVTRSIRGMPISGTMMATFSQANQLLGGLNLLRFEFRPSQDIGNVQNTRLTVIAPPGFIIIKRCTGFALIEIPSASCMGSDANSFYLVFHDMDAIKADVKYTFDLLVQNPTEPILDTINFWRFETVRPDGIAKDTARADGFSLFPAEFRSCLVLPLSRRTGPQMVVVRFVSKEDIPFDDYIRIRAPVGVSWFEDDLSFGTTAAATNSSMSFETQGPTVLAETPNVMFMRLSTTVGANFEYGVAARILVPDQTPIPNRWWVETYRQTGLAPPNNWVYVASIGTDGFLTQLLTNTRITPFSIVKEGWQNPTIVVFQTTMAVFPREQVTNFGVELIRPEIYLEAPDLFTYICPTTRTYYMPDYTRAIPDDHECFVNEQVESERNKLHLYLNEGLEANTRYAFTVDLVNAPLVDLSANVFTLQTRLDGVMQEEAIIPGFQLADRLDNTRYISDASDRRAEALSNTVTFIIGTTMTVPGDTFFVITAPVGFVFDEDCTWNITNATRFLNDNTITPLPRKDLCQNQVRRGLPNEAWVYMTGGWDIAQYALEVEVRNPISTPPETRNFWGFSIWDRTTDPDEPRMTEAWVRSFRIKEILFPMLHPYNPGNEIMGAAAMNIIDVSFTLTTRLPPVDAEAAGYFVLTAPEGFYFPFVCRQFLPDTGAEGVFRLPGIPPCEGDSANTLTITIDPLRALMDGVPYRFRILVENPQETFVQTDTERWWWRMETQLGDGTMEDVNRKVPSFPIYQRLLYFMIDTIGNVGLKSTTLRVHFRTSSPLPPQQTISLYPPDDSGTVFGGVSRGRCFDIDPAIIARPFPEALVSGIARMPEWTSCRIVSPTEVMLRNEEAILGGRPLVEGPVYEFFIMNVTNAQSTPVLNLFRIVARTSTALGQEVWATDGYIIYPELEQVMVTSSNPAFGLYSTFNFNMKVISRVPERGSIQIIAPADYYFGPTIITEEINPLEPRPPAQGESPERPPASQAVICAIERPVDFVCPFEFRQCIELDDLLELENVGYTLSAFQTGTKNRLTVSCAEMTETCNTGDLSTHAQCVSHNEVMEIRLVTNVMIAPMTMVNFNVRGYNSRFPVDEEMSLWHLKTRNADSEQTTLDDKPGVPGIDLRGVIRVPSLNPTDTKVNVVDNQIVVTLRIDFDVPPRAVLRIVHPLAFMRSANAALDGNQVTTGNNFPRRVDTTVSFNEITLTAMEEPIISGVDLVISIGLSNPPYSIPHEDNKWSFETYTENVGVSEMLNCNRNVTGFKIYGEFSVAQVNAAVLSPGQRSIVGVWFVLKSELPRVYDMPPEFPDNHLRLYLPRGFQSLPNCGNEVGSTDFSRTYNKERIVDAPFPLEINYQEIPSGSFCTGHVDENSGLHYIDVNIDRTGRLDYGIDYGFEFAIVNAMNMPPPEENVWRFNTLRNDVILHLRQNIESFELEQIKVVEVTPSDTTRSVSFNRIEFYMMSEKPIDGGARIVITAPRGFIMRCSLFRTDSGLASTTTCFPQEDNILQFTMDSQDPKRPESPFRLFVYVQNPMYTPQENYWNFDIISPLNQFIDVRSMVASFDVTGQLFTNITATFPFHGERNPLRIIFQPTTIMNQADEGNQIVLHAPVGFTFPAVCTGFEFRRTFEQETDETCNTGCVFPPVGTGCTGYNNGTVMIALPYGAGLLVGSYTLSIDVTNPEYELNATEPWVFRTRIRNTLLNGERIVDSNTSVMGFRTRPMEVRLTDEGSAQGARGLRSAVAAVVFIVSALTLFPSRQI